jgi:CheY-like chemotaxis protein
MHGDISVESEKGKGTSFKVSIPTTIVQKKVVSSHIESQPVVDQQSYENCTVLIVEDNELNRIIASEQLSQFKLFNVENGKQALKLLQNKHSNIDVILMDCQMPVMDGYECTQAIRSGEAGERYRDIPIIALTANAMKGDREACLEAGMNDYISKPFKAESLIFAVKTWFEKSLS